MTYKLYLGDCMDFMRTMPDKSVDAVITDPPYGIDYQSARRTDRSQWKPKIINDKEPFLDWIPEAFRITKDGGSLVCFCGWDVENIFFSEIERVGYSVKSQLIWDKIVHGMGDLAGSFAPQHENMWFATKGNYKFNGHRPKDILRVSRVPAEQLVHPNEKPVGIFTSLISNVVPPHGLVLDCFMGVGNCGVGANKTQRNFIGAEIDPTYYAIAEKRIKEATLQPQLFKSEQPKATQEDLL